MLVSLLTCGGPQNDVMELSVCRPSKHCLYKHNSVLSLLVGPTEGAADKAASLAKVLALTANHGIDQHDGNASGSWVRSAHDCCNVVLLAHWRYGCLARASCSGNFHRVQVFLYQGWRQVFHHFAWVLMGSSMGVQGAAIGGITSASCCGSPLGKQVASWLAVVGSTSRGWVPRGNAFVSCRNVSRCVSHQVSHLAGGRQVSWCRWAG